MTGKTPQERGFRDEEAYRTPLGKRPPEMEINDLSRTYYGEGPKIITKLSTIEIELTK